ncbi:MAG: glucosamine-6-phosphate isomerase [Kiritimatiellae bacterium]|nr:glucosamine-6-phosphate isomerase [Kiritimatiellia bacterium]
MKERHDFLAIPASDLGRGTDFQVEILDSNIDLYHDIARAMFDVISRNNVAGKPTAMIVPVGPVFQYRRFARLVRLYDLDLANTRFFFMDEYLNGNGGWIGADSPLSFRGFIQRELIEQLPAEHALREDQVRFPDPVDTAAYTTALTQNGGADLCVAGVGICGHLAFNEAMPEAEISAAEFGRLPTRVLELTTETRTINAHTAANGNIAAIPPRAVTVGMREILASREIRVYMERDWQPAVCRRMMHGPVTPECPASLLQRRGNVHVTITPNVANVPGGALR